MPDINLIHDTEAGEERKAESERRKKKSRVRIELSNPNKESAPPKPLATNPGMWKSMRAMFSGIHLPKMRRSPRPPRILQQHPLLSKDEAPAPVSPPPRRVEEYFAEKSPSPNVVLQPADRQPAPARDTADRPPVRATAEPPPPRQKKSVPQPPEPDHTPGVNLVPEELATGFGTYNRVATLGVVLLLTVATVGLLYLVLTFIEHRIANEAARNQASISAIDRQLVGLNDTKTKAIDFHKTTLETISLINKHIYWTKFFAGLEKYTVDAVYYRGFNADQAGRVTLAATGKDFRAVSRQLIAFTEAKDFVKNVRITSATLRHENDAPLVDFTITLTLDDNVFFRDSRGGPSYIMQQPQ